MRNLKIDKCLVGHDYWPKISIVAVSKNQKAKRFPEELSDESTEKIIQSWDMVAVLRTSPNIPVKVGFIRGGSMQFLKETIETESGKFGMRVGDDDVKFFVIPTDLESQVPLELVALTDEKDLQYSNLPLY